MHHLVYIFLYILQALLATTRRQSHATDLILSLVLQLVVSALAEQQQGQKVLWLPQDAEKITLQHSRHPELHLSPCNLILVSYKAPHRGETHEGSTIVKMEMLWLPFSLSLPESI